MPPHASFESLPAEILLEILIGLSDLESLINLVHASSHASRCFDHYAVEVVDAVLDASSIHKHTQTAIRTVAYIRQGCFPVTTVDDLQRRVTREAILHGACDLEDPPDYHYDNDDDDDDDWRWVHVEVEDAFQPTRLPESVTAKVLRSLLATSRRITRQSLQCLQFYLERLQQLRPMVTVDPDYRLEDVSIVQLHADNPATVPYPISDLGPPTWQEEQLMYRAFWRLQLIKDLIDALENGTITDWANTEAQKLKQMDVTEIYKLDESKPTICLFGISKYGFSDYMYSELTEHSLILSATEYLEQRTRDDGGLAWSRPWPEPLPEISHDGQSLFDCELTADWSSGVCWFDYLFPEALRSRVLSFAPYRQLGFAIWTEARFEGYGLGDPFAGRERQESDLVAWLSVLPGDVVAEAKENEQRLLDGV